MGRPLRVLIVEDSEEDAFLLERELRHGDYEPMSERVASEPAMREALNRQSWDIVISDYVLPGFGGLEALALFHERNLEAPFIVVSGHIGEDIAVAAMKAGADDYLMKDRLARLTPAVSRALERAEIRHARKVAEEQLAAKARELQATVEALRLRESELRESNDKLSQARADLEKRVQERTADLTAANAELKNQMTERKRLENELLEVAENERRRIGFDLHDDIGQKLMGVSLLVKALETNLAHKQLPEADQTREVQGLLGQVINHTHDLARCFSSLDCQDDDLSGLLQKLIANVRRTFRLNCRLRVSEPLPALIPEVKLQLYKIAQESISNAIKH